MKNPLLLLTVDDGRITTSGEVHFREDIVSTAIALIILRSIVALDSNFDDCMV